MLIIEPSNLFHVGHTVGDAGLFLFFFNSHVCNSKASQPRHREVCCK